MRDVACPHFTYIRTLMFLGNLLKLATAEVYEIESTYMCIHKLKQRINMLKPISRFWAKLQKLKLKGTQIWKSNLS